MLHHLTAPTPSPHQLATLHPVNARSDTLLWPEQRHGVFRKKDKKFYSIPSSSGSFQTVSFL